MANIKSAKKRVVQSALRNRRNTMLRSKYRTHLKRVLSALATNKRDDATAAFKMAVSVLDRAVSKGVLHKNSAARHKSRLNDRLKQLA